MLASIVKTKLKKLLSFQLPVYGLIQTHTVWFSLRNDENDANFVCVLITDSNILVTHILADFFSALSTRAQWALHYFILGLSCKSQTSKHFLLSKQDTNKLLALTSTPQRKKNIIGL